MSGTAPDQKTNIQGLKDNLNNQANKLNQLSLEITKNYGTMVTVLNKYMDKMEQVTTAVKDKFDEYNTLVGNLQSILAPSPAAPSPSS